MTMTRRLDPMQVQQQISNLLLAHPELAGDDVLRADMVEGATDAFEFLSQIVERIRETAVLAGGASTVIADLEVRRERLERRQAALRELAFKVMQAADLPKAELPTATLSIRKGTPKVIITDEAALPDDCFRVKREPDKEAIKVRLAILGLSVPGAELSNAEPSLSIRIK